MKEGKIYHRNSYKESGKYIMIITENLTKSFKDIKAVDGINFRIDRGEIYGLIGENGAGKTTTLRLLATMLSPTEGTAVINGNDINKNPDKVRENIGILFGGETGLYDRLSARENIEYFGRLNGFSKKNIDRRISELSDIFQMNEYIDRRIGGFSKGMKQKVAIARSIVHDPDILLLDEPTSGLDIGVTRIVHEFIKRLTKNGKTVIFSSHNMDEVKKLCDKILVMNKGRIIYDGYIKDLEEQKGKNLDDAFIDMVGDRNV
ncbi:MAG: ATP-binding cassette domain-containing protein [Andreesenia angusta]|nr:ATP-binding cassette domain-containing protein [Andreesenia angusta]